MSVQVEVRKSYSSTGRLKSVTVKIVRDSEIMAEATDEGQYLEDDDEFSTPDEQAAGRAALAMLEKAVAEARAQLRFVVGGMR